MAVNKKAKKKQAQVDEMDLVDWLLAIDASFA